MILIKLTTNPYLQFYANFKHMFEFKKEKKKHYAKKINLKNNNSPSQMSRLCLLINNSNSKHINKISPEFLNVCVIYPYIFRTSQNKQTH